MKLSDLQQYFVSDAVIVGDEHIKVDELRAMNAQMGSNAITYMLAAKLPHHPVDVISFINSHPAKVVITDFRQDFSDRITKTVIYTSRPRLQMAKLSMAFATPIQTVDQATLRSYWPGAHVSPSAYVAEDVKIGQNTIVYANATIYRGVTIGDNCIIHSGAVIGADGFGYEKDEDGNWFKIAHLGGVVVGNNVDIGANACIDRGTLGDTVIEDGAKIDNLVHIAHNVRVKARAMIIANSMIAGSVVIGEDAWVAPSSSIREGKIIGAKALVGLGSVVVKDVEPGTTVMGVPAKEKA